MDHLSSVQLGRFVFFCFVFVWFRLFVFYLRFLTIYYTIDNNNAFRITLSTENNCSQDSIFIYSVFPKFINVEVNLQAVVSGLNLNKSFNSLLFSLPNVYKT